MSKHNWVYDGHDSHKNQEDYTCIKCGKSDWIATYQDVSHLNSDECVPQITRSLKDFRGVTFRVGDEVVYPGRCGSSLWMSRGFIVKIGEDRMTVRTMSGRNTVLRRLDRVTIIPS